MSFVTVALILIAIIAIMGGVIFALIRDIKSLKKENAETKNRLESARVNIEHLSKYIDDLLKIKSDEKSVSQKIKEAKSDEEVFNIIADIVGANNNRVQNNESN